MEEIPTSSNQDSLEILIFYDPPEDVELTRTQVYLEEYQYSAMEIIISSVGCDWPDVMQASHRAGLSTVRDDIGWRRMEETFELRAEFQALLSNDITSDEQKSVPRIKLRERTEEFSARTGDDLTDQQRFYVRESMANEIETNFCRRGHIKMGVMNRALIGIGLQNSSIAQGDVDSKARKLLEDLEQYVCHSRRVVERSIADYVSIASLYWDRNGIPEKVKTRLENIQPMIEGEERKQRLRLAIDNAGLVKSRENTTTGSDT